MNPLPFSIASSTLCSALLALLQTAGARVAIKAADSGRYLWVGESYATLLGHSIEQMVGADDVVLLDAAVAATLRTADQRAVRNGQCVEDEHRIERDGRLHLIRAQRLVMTGNDGAAQLLQIWWDDTQQHHDQHLLQQALRQIEQQHLAFAQLQRQQMQGFDRPTELFRHDQFEDHLRREVALSHREHREFALALMALDGFDQLCRDKGRAAADQALEAVGQLLRSNTRAMDVITRLSDDRYVVLLSGVGLATAHTRMEQLRRQCATHMVVAAGQPLGFEVSVGVASFPHTASTMDSLSGAAERALAEAIRRGGNRVALASISLAQRQPVEVLHRQD